MHPIDILKKEHERILENIDELEGIVRISREGRRLSADDVESLKEIVNLLIEAENHHAREEKVLFPLLEEKDIKGPPSVMKMEHEELRRNKKALEAIVKKLTVGDKLSQEFFHHAEFILNILRDHIYKENNILYPMAMDVVEIAKWADVKRAFDRIGYCRSIKIFNMDE